MLDAVLATLGAATIPACCTCTCTRWRCRRTPEQALPAADLLRRLVPDARTPGHMPSHIDVLCGDYRGSDRANQVAVPADRNSVDRRDR